MLHKEGIDRWNALRFALVLSGGGAKGAYEAGAIKAMRAFDVARMVYGVSGTSVGALNALLFAIDDGALMEEVWENIALSTVAPRKESEGKSGFFGMIKDISTQLSEDQGLCTQDSLRALITDTVDFAKARAHRAALFACAYDIAAKDVTYFPLKELSDEDMLNAVLASASIPHVYAPVDVGGRLYADGGINEPSYGVKNSDPTPVSPLQDGGYDIMLVIHLNEQERREMDHIGSTRLIHIFPSKPLEAVKGTGTMIFSRAVLRERFEMGYQDMMCALGLLLMEYLGGNAPLGERTVDALES